MSTDPYPITTDPTVRRTWMENDAMAAGEGYGTDFPHPAAECGTCHDTGWILCPDQDGEGAYETACPDCDQGDDQ